MFYEVMKFAFISLQPHPVNDTSIIENVLRKQQGELVFKPTQNGWNNVWLKLLTALKFRKHIDMGNQKPNFLDVKDVQNTATSLLRKIQDLQDPTTTCSSWIQDPQDQAENFISEIQDP